MIIKIPCPFCKKVIEAKEIFTKDSFGRPSSFYRYTRQHTCLEGQKAAEINRNMMSALVAPVKVERKIYE